VLEGEGEEWLQGSDALVQLRPGVTLVLAPHLRHWFRATVKHTPLKRQAAFWPYGVGWEEAAKGRQIKERVAMPVVHHGDILAEHFKVPPLPHWVTAQSPVVACP
jgi:hypothetical protein